MSGRAYLEGKALRLATWPPPPPVPGAPAPAPGLDETVRLVLPQGWRVVVDPPILFRPDGACSGGNVVIESGDVRRSFRLEAPRCRIR